MYGDGKAFVDMPLKVAPGRPCRPFAACAATDEPAVHRGDFGTKALPMAPLPKDWTPEFPQRVDADHVELMAAIHAMWPKLPRVSGTHRKAPQRALPSSCRAGGFARATTAQLRIVRTTTVWDEGDGTGIVPRDDVRNFGYVPNGNRTYYAAGRSPLLAEMVSLPDDDALTAEAALAIEIELSWCPGAAVTSKARVTVLE